MQQIEVTARFASDGKIYPTELIHEGRKYTIEDTGRRWQDEAGLHILVMVGGLRVLELIFQAAEARWYLKNPVRGPGVA